MVDILTKAGRFLGISNREGAQIGAALAAGNLGQAALTTLTSLGGEGRFEKEAVDVSAPPAGVDSPATLSRTSQTSRTLDIYGDEMIIPELLQSKCNPKEIYKLVSSFLEDQNKIKKQISNTEKVLESFRTKNLPTDLAADSIRKSL